MADVEVLFRENKLNLHFEIESMSCRINEKNIVASLARHLLSHLCRNRKDHLQNVIYIHRTLYLVYLVQFINLYFKNLLTYFLFIQVLWVSFETLLTVQETLKSAKLFSLRDCQILFHLTLSHSFLSKYYSMVDFPKTEIH